ncbi:FAD:protein FMN transferase [Kaarinaea lacus]
MASPCELLVDTNDTKLATKLAQIAQQEAARIENKFSRYRNDNIVYAINSANGDPVEVDEETADLLDYAQQCYQLSEGLFDITSGILRRAWKFDGSDNIPDQQQIDSLLLYVGWEKLRWQRPTITLQPGMEIDFGGIGKEYAVDRTAKLIQKESGTSCLINFGGDICVTKPRSLELPWTIGIEDPDKRSRESGKVPHIQLGKGAIATSGDANRYLVKDGIRYGHILNPRTGWAVSEAPRSVTVAANTCTEAGILSTLALLHDANAEQFLKLQEVKYWCEW